MMILRWDGQAPHEQPDELAEEEPLEIRVRGRAVSVTMRTPGHDEELALGFLLTEGIIRSPRDVLRVEPCGRNEDGNLLNVVLAPEVPVDFERLTRHVFASSSCGLCGKVTIDAVRSQFPPVTSDLVMDAQIIARWRSGLLRQPNLSASTVAKAYRVLRQALAAAVEARYLAVNPASIKGAAVEPRSDLVVPTIDEALALAAAMPERLRLLVLLYGFAGQLTDLVFGG